MAWSHYGYFILAIKMIQLLATGCELKMLLTDIHAFSTVSEYQLRWLNNQIKFY